MSTPSLATRLCLIVGGVLISVGGPMHPGGTMVQMLADPIWFPSHAMITVGFLAFIVGLELLRRQGTTPRVQRWLVLALAATVLQTIDMALHTMAYVDGPALAAEQATPVLDAHLAMTAVAYPVFGALLAVFMVVAGRERVLGSNWISWIGVTGCIGHGLAGPLTVVWGIPWAPILFPLIVLVAVWGILAGVWPSRARAATQVAETA